MSYIFKTLTFAVLIMIYSISGFAEYLCNDYLKVISPKFKSDILNSYELPIEFANKYYAKRIEPFLSNPHYTEVQNPRKFYRGMYITVDELIDILQNGFNVEKVNWTVGTGKSISFSSDINEAATYIFHNATDRKRGIGVVFEVEYDSNFKMLTDTKLNPTKTIFTHSKDLEPEAITGVFIWGEYGLDKLSEIFKKSISGELKPHTDWTNQFQ